MSDLDNLLAGKRIYRNEDKEAISDKWEGWADFLQFGSLGLLLMSVILFNALGKDIVKHFIWYWAAVMFILATTAFIVARVALKHKMRYLNAEGDRVSNLMDEAIDKVKS